MDKDIWNSVSVGTDPEFIVRDVATKKRCNISKVILRSPTDKFGRENALTLELRPSGWISFLRLVKETKKLMKENAPYTLQSDTIEWICGAFLYKQPLGGHLHMGLAKSDELMSFSGNKLASLATKLDLFIGMPLRLLDSTEQIFNRWNAGYGDYMSLMAGACRTQNYPNNAYGLEYRTPSSKFLQHPDIMLGMLGMLKFLVVDTLMEKGTIFSKRFPFKPILKDFIENYTEKPFTEPHVSSDRVRQQSTSAPSFLAALPDTFLAKLLFRHLFKYPFSHQLALTRVVTDYMMEVLDVSSLNHRVKKWILAYLMFCLDNYTKTGTPEQDLKKVWGVKPIADGAQMPILSSTALWQQVQSILRELE